MTDLKSKLHCETGLAHYRVGKYHEAIKYFSRAIDINSEYATAYYHRGLAYGRLGRYKEAIEDYNKAIEIDPKCAAAYDHQDLSFGELDNQEQAIEDYNKAIEIDSRDPYTEKQQLPDVMTLLCQTEKPQSREKKMRKIYFPSIVTLGVFFALLFVCIVIFFWSSTQDDAIKNRLKIYPPGIDNQTNKAVAVPPLEDAKVKSQTEMLSVIDSLKSSNGKKYAIQVKAYPETDTNAAKEFVINLRRRQPDVRMEKVYIQGRGVWYRILVGQFATHEEASTYMNAKKILNAYPGSFVQLTTEE